MLQKFNKKSYSQQINKYFNGKAIYLQELCPQVLVSVIETGILHLVRLFLSRSQGSSKFRRVSNFY